MDFPPNLYIRPLTIDDLDQVVTLEHAVHTSAAASPATLRYRLIACPELCAGLFLREYIGEFNQVNLPDVAARNNRLHHDHVRHVDFQPDEPGRSAVVGETLVAHVLATKIPGTRVTIESTLPPDETVTRNTSTITAKSAISTTTNTATGTGHCENSRTIGIHSVCVAREWQRNNFATLLLHDYIQKLANQDLGDQIALACDENLASFYAKIGFVKEGVSLCSTTDRTLFDMVIDLVPEEY